VLSSERGAFRLSEFPCRLRFDANRLLVSGTYDETDFALAGWTNNAAHSIVGSGSVTVSSNTGVYTIGYSGAGITLADVTNVAVLNMGGKGTNTYLTNAILQTASATNLATYGTATSDTTNGPLQLVRGDWATNIANASASSAASAATNSVGTAVFGAVATTNLSATNIWAGTVTASAFQGPATGQGSLSVKGTITSETNENNYIRTTNEITVGTTNLIQGIANLAALTNAFATRTLGITVSGGGSAITTGVKGVLEVPYACTIKQATVLALNSGAIVFDVWKTNYANYPPVIGGTITASAKPTITATGNKAQDATLTGWTTALAAGDILLFNVDSCTSITNASLFLKVSVP